MKKLTTYVLESLNSGSFSQATDTFDKLIKYANYLNAKNFYDILKPIFDKISQENTSKTNNVFLWAKAHKYFKMDYPFNPIILRIAKEHSDKLDVTIKNNGKKIALYYIGDGKRTKIMETGKGSVGRVKTEVQEHSTCYVFNKYIDIIENDNEDMSTMDDLNQIKAYIADIYAIEVEDMDNSWLVSFGKQVKAIISFIRSFGGDPINFRLARFDEKDKKSIVSKAYTRMVKSYVKYVGGEGRNMKDTYDPSDVILFDKTYISDIESICVAGKNINDCCNIKSKYFNELFATHKCMGISLKKITKSDGSADLFNVGTHNVVEIVKSFKITKESETNLTVLCIGSFNFDGITSEDGKLVGTEKEVLLTMRTFGGGNVAVDVKLNENGEPALGKCPVKVWRKAIDYDYKDIEGCVNKFKYFLESASKNDICDLIKAAVKEGPHCFPFILLH